MDQHRFHVPVAPGALKPCLAPFDGIVRTALAKAMDDRYPSLNDFIAALPAIRSGGPPVEAPPPRRGRWLWPADLGLVATGIFLALCPVSAGAVALASPTRADVAAPRADAGFDPAEARRAELDGILHRQGVPPTPAACRARDAGLISATVRALELEHPGDSSKALAAAVATQPRTAEVAEPFALLARAEVAAGERVAAGESAKEAHRLCPELALALDVTGNLEQEDGNLKEAETAYRRALELAPEYDAPRFNLAMLALRRKEYPAALELLDELLGREPAYPHAHLLRGQANLLLGHAEHAIADLEEATGGDPQDGTAWLLLGQARWRAGQKSVARDAFCRARQLGIAEAGKFCAR